MLVNDRRGFTLTEMLVVMVIFLVIMMITATSFKTVANNSSQQSKSAETQIEGIIGLEVLRADIEQAGFGLPWTFQPTAPAVTYTECTAGAAAPTNFWPGSTSPASFNDAPFKPPRAVVSGDTTFNADGTTGSKYLVIKSTVAATNDAAKKWMNVSYNGSKIESIWGSADRDFKSTDQVIVLQNVLNTVPPTRQLRAVSSTGFSAPFAQYTTLTSPHLSGDTFQVYGLNTGTAPAMPFNRADFYVRRPTDNMPKDCADSPGVGILYKSTITSSGGLSIGTPLLDCVADMQVVYGLDTSGAGIVNSHTTVPLDTADLVRSQLREIRVYILAQEGQKDLLYTYPSENIVVGEDFGGTIQGRVFNLKDRIGANIYKNYRWKVYTIVVRPKNLGQ